MHTRRPRGTNLKTVRYRATAPHGLCATLSMGYRGPQCPTQLRTATNPKQLHICFTAPMSSIRRALTHATPHHADPVHELVGARGLGVGDLAQQGKVAAVLVLLCQVLVRLHLPTTRTMPKGRTHTQRLPS